MMHLKYPRKPGFLYWDELGCLARALGFHEKLFLHHLPDELMIGQLGIPIKTLFDAFDYYKTFHTALDRTYNIHTDEWNISVIKKALHLLDKHVFTFEDIQVVRITYQVYESQDTRGLPLHEKTLQRVIKMCDRMISPLKMMQRIKHMVQHFEEKDRMQLHELLDLLLWCELYEGAAVKREKFKNEKDERKLFKLEDFEHLLTYYDECLARQLNDQYIEEELKFTKERFGSKSMPKDVPPVDPQIRKKQVQYHKDRYRFLHEQINDSSLRVNASRAGYVRSRPVSAPDILMFQHTDPSVAVSALDPRPCSVREMFPHIIRPLTAETTSQDIQSEFPRPSVSEYQRPKTPVAVTEEDVAKANNKINTLKFEMETIEMKYKQFLNEDLDCLVPGYRQRAVKEPRTPPPPPVVKKQKKEARPSKAIIDKLANPHRKETPTPSHAKTCDARFRGWYKVNTQHGHHFILVQNQFDRSPNGQMLAKLQKRTDAEVKKEPVVYRFTQRHQVTAASHRVVSPAEMTRTGLSTPAAPSFLEPSTPSSKQPSKSESSSEMITAGVSCQSDGTGNGKSPAHDEEYGTQPEGVWADVAIFPSESSSGSSGSSSSPSQHSPDPSIVQVYLPPRKGTVKGAEFLRGRGGKLEGIEEATEEEVEKQDNTVVTLARSPDEKTEMETSNDKPRTPVRDTAVTIILPEKETVVMKETLPSEDESGRKDGGVTVEKKISREPFTSWLKGHKKVKQYPWIADIVKKEITKQDDEQQRYTNFSCLARRADGLISREFRQKLTRGIPA